MVRVNFYKEVLFHYLMHLVVRQWWSTQETVRYLYDKFSLVFKNNPKSVVFTVHTKLGQGLLLIWSFWQELTGHQLETQHSEFQVAPSFTDHILILKPEFGSLVSNMSLFSLETNALQCQAKAINLPFCLLGKVIYTKYSKRWPYTVAHTIDCVCRKC